MLKNDRQRLFAFIEETAFAIDDVILYLDTHPEDCQALEYYENYKKLYQEAVREYTQLYGPLSRNDVDTCDYWTWVSEPWPWEAKGRSVCH